MLVTIFGGRLPLLPAEGMSSAMTKRRTPASGGIFLFLGPVVGAIYGAYRGEPILWMLVGFGVALALALAIWLVDRRKG